MIARRTASLRARAARDDGFTLVELLIARTVLAVGLVAIIGGVDRSNGLTLTSQDREQMSAYGQRELERLRTYPYDSLALNSLPAASGTGLTPDDGEQSNPRNPSYYVSGSNFKVKSDYSNSSSGPPPNVASGGEQMVSGGTLSPGPDTVTLGTTKFLVYRYITWRDDPGCTSCPGTQDTKRITVAVAPADTSSREARSVRPMYFSTVVSP